MTADVSTTPVETPEQFMRREVDGFRTRIGIDFQTPLFDIHWEQATHDAIRRYAFAVGDDNPLWWDRDYAARSRWGGIVAIPSFLVAAGRTLPEFEPSAEEAARGKNALAGLNSMHCGDNARWFQPVREGDYLFVRRFFIGCELKGGADRGWAAISTFRHVYWNHRDEVVCIWDIDQIHPYNRPSAGSDEPTARSSDYLDEIDQAYDAEELRGSTPRFVETVSVGDAIPKRTKGPLATSDVVAMAVGLSRHDLAPNRLGRKKRRAGEDAYYRNGSGAWDSYMACHWDQNVSSAFGMEKPFDWGMMRTTHMIHAVTDWMGDDALLVSYNSRIRAINLMGNVTTVTGRVTGMTGDGDSAPGVVCEMTCTNEEGVVTATATMNVCLPSKTSGLPRYPRAPIDRGLLPGMRGYLS